MSGQIRLLITTPDTATRVGLSKLLDLDDDFQVVGTAKTAREGLQKADELNPDIVFTGMVQPDLSSLDFISRIRAKHPSMGIIVVSLADKPQTIQDAYTAGANAYVVKPVVYDELEAAVRQTYSQVRTGRQDAAAERAEVEPAQLVKDAESPNLFVSYSRTEWDEFVEPLVLRLRDAGFDVWVDQHLLHGGDYWFDKINEALQNSDILVLCVTEEALSSKFVKMEYRYFFMRDKPIFPVICRPVENLPAELSIIQYIDYDPDLLIEHLTQWQTD